MRFKNFFIPDFLPYLKSGTGFSPQEGGCVIQAASYLWDGNWSDGGDDLGGDDLGAINCVNDYLRRRAIEANDGLGDTERQQLWLLVPRLLGTTTYVDDMKLERFWQEWWNELDPDETGERWSENVIAGLTALIDEYYRLSGDVDEGIPVERWAALAEATSRKEVQVKDGTATFVAH